VVHPNHKTMAQEVRPPCLDRGDQDEHFLPIGGESEIMAMECLAEIGNGPPDLHQNSPNAKAGRITLEDEQLGEIR